MLTSAQPEERESILQKRLEGMKDEVADLGRQSAEVLSEENVTKAYYLLREADRILNHTSTDEMDDACLTLCVGLLDLLARKCACIDVKIPSAIRLVQLADLLLEGSVDDEESESLRQMRQDAGKCRHQFNFICLPRTAPSYRIPVQPT